MGKSGKKVFATVIAFCFILSTVLCSMTAFATDTATLVSGTDSSPSISNANTTRKLAVASDGTIYATYHSDNGIMVAKSADDGATFSTHVQVYSENYEAEVAVSTDGTVYVVWAENGTIKLSKSTDKAATFSTPVEVGDADGTSHMDTDGNYIYIIQRHGRTLYRSTDSGSTFTAVSLSTDRYVFSDVHVDAATHKVVVQEDNPSIKYYVSSDYGATFGDAVSPENAAVYDSVGSLASDSTGLYLVIAGEGSDSVKINLNNGAVDNPSMGNGSSRSLSSDAYGNVVTGYAYDSNVYLMVSNDLGATFSEAKPVAAASEDNAAINTTNGDVLFLYQSSGDGKIYLKTYSGILKGYGLNVSNSSLYFNANNNELTKDISIKNVSGSSLAINSITTTGDFSIDRSSIGSTMSTSQQSTIHVNFNPTAAGTSTGKIVINYGSPAQEKVINLSGYLLAENIAIPQITSQPQSTTVVGNQNATFSVTSSSPLSQYQWYKDGNAISGATSRTYTISKAQTSDAGSYKVVVSNAAGAVTSNTATLSVDWGNPDNTPQKRITADASNNTQAVLTNNDISDIGSGNVDITVGNATLSIPASIVSGLVSDDLSSQLKFSQTSSSSAAQTAAEKALPKNNAIVASLDLDLTKFYSNGNTEKIHQLGGEIKVTINLTDEQIAKITDAKTAQLYYLNTETNKLELINNATFDLKAKTVTFYINHFSTFVIAQSKAVKTGDYSPIFLMVSIIIGSGTSVYFIYRYKKRSYNF